VHRRNGSADCEGNPAVLGVSSERIKLGSGGHELSTIGYIIPGLIIARQGVLRTVASVILLSAAVRLILIVAGLI